MKKVLLSFAVIALALTLVGCGQKEQSPPSDNQMQNQETQGPDQSKKSLAGQVINSAEAVKNAILGGQKLECTYKMKNGNSMGEIKGYIDGKKYKSSFEMNGEKYISIMDGEMMYSWSEKTKQGTKMNIQCMQDLGKSLPQNDSQNSYKSSEDMADNMMDISCQPSSSVDFSVPSDVTFTDTCEQMKKTMEQLQNMKGFSTGKDMPTFN